MAGGALGWHMGKIFLILVAICAPDPGMPTHERKARTRVVEDFRKIGRKGGPR